MGVGAVDNCSMDINFPPKYGLNKGVLQDSQLFREPIVISYYGSHHE